MLVSAGIEIVETCFDVHVPMELPLGDVPMFAPIDTDDDNDTAAT